MSLFSLKHFSEFFTLTLVSVTVLSFLHPSYSSAAYDPKLQQHSLFDRAEFVRIRRAVRADRINKDVYYNPPISSRSSVSSLSSSISLLEYDGTLTLEDLSSTERDTLRKQLRVRACPAHAHAGYKKLCESLLKLTSQRSVQQGTLTDKIER